MSKAVTSFNTLYITPEAYVEMWQYIKNCPTEVGGMGVVEDRKVGEVTYSVVTRILLFEHENASAANFDLNQKQIAKWMGQVIMESRSIEDPDEREKHKSQYKKLKFHFHKHPGSCVDPSRKDLRIQEGFPGEYCFFLIGNKKGKYSLVLRIYKPFEVLVREIELKVFDEEVLQTQHDLDKLKSEKVFALSSLFRETKNQYVEELKKKVPSAYKKSVKGRKNHKKVYRHGAYSSTASAQKEDIDDLLYDLEDDCLIDPDTGEIVKHDFFEYDETDASYYDIDVDFDDEDIYDEPWFADPDVGLKSCQH